MGQVQSLWERVGVRQNRIDALAKEKAHARDQCDQMAAAQTNAQKEIGQLRAHNEQLQRQNESAPGAAGCQSDPTAGWPTLCLIRVQHPFRTCRSGADQAVDR